jgi:hypothetical protein
MPGGKIAFALLVGPERGGNPTRRLTGGYGTVTGDGRRDGKIIEYPMP